MANIMTFKRYEMKYLISRRQKDELMRSMSLHMKLDEYGYSSVRSVYYDTPDYLLIRRSLESPIYKEKLRLRSYGWAGDDDDVFIELKKKYKSVVYKRRLSLPRFKAEACLQGCLPMPDTQIGGEIAYALSYYKDILPAMFISCERQAFRSRDVGDFRVTFDENIFCRQQALYLNSPPDGIPLIGSDSILMELKTPDAIPLWMVNALTELGIFKCSFSKYGTAYEKLILNSGKGVCRYA